MCIFERSGRLGFGLPEFPTADLGMSVDIWMVLGTFKPVVNAGVYEDHVIMEMRNTCFSVPVDSAADESLAEILTEYGHLCRMATATNPWSTRISIRPTVVPHAHVI